MSSLPGESVECAEVFYNYTDALEKCIRHISKTDISLILSTVDALAAIGRNLPMVFSKAAIVQKCRNSQLKGSDTENRIKVFEEMYDRFNKEILHAADCIHLYFDFYEQNSSTDVFEQV